MYGNYQVITDGKPTDVIATWFCPNCHNPNSDSYKNTAVPLCFSCGNEYHWDDLLGKDEMTELNEALKKMGEA